MLLADAGKISDVNRRYLLTDGVLLAAKSWRTMMKTKLLLPVSLLLLSWGPIAWGASDTGEAVPRERYANREVSPDPSARPCPDLPRTLTQVRDNLYRHTNTALPALHSGFVLVTSEGARHRSGARLHGRVAA